MAKSYQSNTAEHPERRDFATYPGSRGLNKPEAIPIARA